MELKITIAIAAVKAGVDFIKWRVPWFTGRRTQALVLLLSAGAAVYVTGIADADKLLETIGILVAGSTAVNTFTQRRP